jgi:hypothetical protein
MRLLKKSLSWTLSLGLALTLSSLFLSQVSFGAAVKVCKKLKEDKSVDSSSDLSQDKRVFCTISPKLGTVGDYIEIKNQYNYIVGVGRVVKQGRVGTIVVLTHSDPKEGSMAGYPAMVRINESQDYWTATTAPF